MIYTITFNPALDYIVRLEQLKTGTINRTTQEYVLGGGKGINVSIVLNNLGMDTTALGFIAGFTGEEIVTQLNSFGVKEDFIRLREGLTRINVKAVSYTHLNRIIVATGSLASSPHMPVNLPCSWLASITCLIRRNTPGCNG